MLNSGRIVNTSSSQLKDFNKYSQVLYNDSILPTFLPSTYCCTNEEPRDRLWFTIVAASMNVSLNRYQTIGESLKVC